ASQWVLHAAVAGLRRVVESGAILGNVDRYGTVTVLEPKQEILERRSVDLPAGLRVRSHFLGHCGGLQRPLNRIVPNDVARVIIDADEVDRLGDLGKVG